jgi:hypothetical protein
MLLGILVLVFVLSMWCKFMLYDMEIAELKKKIRNKTNAVQDTQGRNTRSGDARNC